MPKYLIKAAYSAEGAKGVLKEGGSKRREAIEQSTRSMGGTVEAFYFAFGETDAYVIIDIPDPLNAIAASLVVNASGTVKATYTVLITPEEVDEAAKRSMDYRPPGQ